MKQLAVIGTGYVGLTTGAAFAEMGNHVVCLDIDEAKVSRLRQGIMPIFEPGLQEVVVRNMEANRLHFTTSYKEALREAEFVFIAVGTPDNGNGGADLSQVRSAAQSIACHLTHSLIVINKSTVPLGTGDLVTAIITEHKATDVPFAVVSNPEFLREGSALSDCMHPERVVLGATDRNAAEEVARLYLSLKCAIIITDLRTAEMIKYASNAFLATKISFINEMAGICERLGADVKQVAMGMGYDDRIGSAFLNAGLGYGGSCFPKDVKALMRMADDADLHPQLLQAVVDINQSRRQWVVDKLVERLGDLHGKRVGLLGLAFKPDTDDIREAPALDIIGLVQQAGGQIAAYDPAARDAVAAMTEGVTFCRDAYEVAEDADALVLVTEWNEFKNLDLGRIQDSMRRAILVDGRNLYEPQQALSLGFDYIGVARGHALPASPIPASDLIETA